MEPDDFYFVKLAISNVAFLGFMGSCAVVGTILMLELARALGLVRREDDDE